MNFRSDLYRRVAARWARLPRSKRTELLAFLAGGLFVALWALMALSGLRIHWKDADPEAKAPQRSERQLADSRLLRDAERALGCLGLSDKKHPACSSPRPMVGE